MNRFLLFSHRHADLNGEFSVDEPTCLDRAGHPYFGRVLHHLNQKIPDAELTFVVTTFYTEKLPEYGRNVVACVLEDELSRETHFRDQVGTIFRCYPNLPSHLDGVKGFKPIHRLGGSYVVTRDFLRGAAGRMNSMKSRAAGRSLAPIFEIPIGYLANAEVDFVPFQKRGIDAYFCGSISHLDGQNAQRVLARLRPKSLERLQMKGAMVKVGEQFPDIRITHRYTASFEESAATSQFRYLSDMMNAKFSLAPRGGVPHTYRFFEAIRFGTIPIGETFPRSYEEAPFVRLDSWRDLPSVLHRLLNQGQEEMLEMHERALAWWKDKAAEDIIASRMQSQLSLAGMLRGARVGGSG